MSNLKFILVSPDEQGLRLDKFLVKYFSTVPYSIIQKKIRLGIFKVNGKKKSCSYKVFHLDKVYFKDNIVSNESDRNKVSLPEKFKILLQKSVLYEDEFILILNKPYGVPVQGGSKISFSIDDALSCLCSDNSSLRLTHRIDRNTTGILIIAKSKEAAKDITKLFKEDKVKKTYWTLVIGKPKSLEGSIKTPISKVNLNGIEKMKVVENNKKMAITYYQTLETKEGLSLIEVYPKTGRTHQIRVHLLSKECPVLGDRKYKLFKIKENKFYKKDYKMHLHAKSIRFKLHNKTYSFEANLPYHFIKTLRDNKFKTLFN